MSEDRDHHRFDGPAMTLYKATQLAHYLAKHGHHARAARVMLDAGEYFLEESDPADQRRETET